MDDETRQDRETSRRLAASDLSGESGVRESLKARLLRAARRGAEPEARRLSPAVRGTFALAAGLAAALVILQLSVPAFSASLRTFFSRWLLGRGTEVRNFVPERVAEAEARPRTWVVQTSVGNFSGDVPAGASPDLRFFKSLDEARKAVAGLYAPARVPAGFRLDTAILTPLGGALFIYESRTRELVVYQTPTRLRHTVASDVRKAEVMGVPALWIEDGYGLVWEKDGVSFNVGGRGLGLDAALKVARSLSKEAL